MQAPPIKNKCNDIARLRWACRRGMLELDVLLENFLNEGYSRLTLSEKEQFIALLNCSDPELFAWLMGRETPADAAWAALIEKIRQHAQSRI